MHDLSGGGVERMRLALIAELRARGLQVTLIVGRRRGALATLVPADLAVVELGKQGMLGAVRPLARALRRLRPDVLVSSLDHNNVSALLANRLASTGTRLVICQHNALSAETALGWKYRAVPWLYWLLHRRAHGVVAVSTGVADDLAAVAGIPRHRITPIHNPVITADFADRASGEPPHVWLARTDAPVVLFAGRLTLQKDPGLLIEAFAALTLTLAVRLIILGDGPFLVQLQEQAARLGVAEHVLFAGFQANPLPWISHASCLVLPSRYEGLGNVLVEALACGTPVVATDCPHGPSEILDGGRFGELVAVGDAAAMAPALQRAVTTVPDRPALRARAAAFTAAASADAHLALFDTILRRRAAPVFGLPVSPLRADEVVDAVLGETAAGVRLVVTPNIDHVRLLRRSDFAAAYAAAHLVCPDGFPVLLYARLRGLRLPARVTGCELFGRLVQHPAVRAQRLSVVVEADCTRRALHRWADAQGLDGLHVITAPPDMGADARAQADLARTIARAAPDVLVMTLGAPVSEVFVHTHRAMLGDCWALCVGQAVRVHLGLVQRAPATWQRLGLEWLWRVRQEPARLTGRYVRALLWFPVAIAGDVRRKSC